VEDSGLPALLRDTQVLSIWEGTTNVLALEVYRAVLRADALPPALEDVRARARAAMHPRLRPAAAAAERAAGRIEAWWAGASARGAAAHEAGARRFALSLGRTFALALLLEHADWSLAHERDARAAEAALRFAAHGVDVLGDADPDPAAQARLALGLAGDAQGD
jgi:hypothetical protein